MDVHHLAIPDVMLLTPRLFTDERGWFQESYSLHAMKVAGLEEAFVQDNHSMSKSAGTVRGLHFQLSPHAQGKLIRVVKGAIFDVALDLRTQSATYGHHVSAEISAENRHSIWIPPGFAHGFCTLEPATEVVYKATDYYYPEYERGILWNDAALGISWPVPASQATVSDRDRAFPELRDFAPTPLSR